MNVCLRGRKEAQSWDNQSATTPSRSGGAKANQKPKAEQGRKVAPGSGASESSAGPRGGVGAWGRGDRSIRQTSRQPAHPPPESCQKAEPGSGVPSGDPVCPRFSPSPAEPSASPICASPRAQHKMTEKQGTCSFVFSIVNINNQNNQQRLHQVSQH